jgi:RimJ/RimL family protein N-acetyltransferase
VKIRAVVLEDAFVRLEPLAADLKEPMRAALDCDPASWDIMVGAAYGPHFEGWWSSAMTGMADGSRVTWAVRRKSDGALAGTSSLYEIQPQHRRCEIGSTFYRPEARGGAVNPACKRLLFAHAFDSGAVRVEIITDAVNEGSQAAIRKLGARFEGRLAKHKITWTGRVRDTVMFAVTDDDWPAVRVGLDQRLEGF